MEANELMIGDIIQAVVETVDDDDNEVVYKVPARVKAIDENGMLGEDGKCSILVEYLVKNEMDCYETFDDIEPIPLTDEIFKQNGFYVYSKDDYSEVKLDVEIDNLNYQICGTRNADKWHISIYKIKWEDRTKGKYNSCCLFSSGLFGEYDQIYVHEIQHYLRVSGLNALADKLKIE